MDPKNLNPNYTLLGCLSNPVTLIWRLFEIWIRPEKNRILGGGVNDHPVRCTG
jgi:hypothetical protein